MSAEDEVRTVSLRFYAALTRMANGDAKPLAAIWSHGAMVTALHPIGGRQVGWDAVFASFEQVARLASGGKVELHQQCIHVAGELACETGVEQGQITLADQQVAIEHRVTNLYRRAGDSWKMIHHHTDISPAMLAVLERLARAGDTQR
ncbi:ketosteroid isomerase-like protein [Oceanisphaera litoralis]|uniref:YybH family protein n=1 Tax=Oceanisphaera litoralis TaxID=225144 RepID=UPI001956B22F|nr:nuclear transport factor 2 family protein [Oceanisphaera litoralis]MBM7456831.1 ketosteroid isomerase-like protein [Oceanisphaera litoralis]